MASPVINKDECSACAACADQCPVEAIAETDDGYYQINPDICVECEGYADSPQCVDICPSEAITYAG